MWKSNFGELKFNEEFIDKLANSYLKGNRNSQLIEFLNEIKYSTRAGGKTLKEILDDIIEMELD